MFGASCHALTISSSSFSLSCRNNSSRSSMAASTVRIAVVGDVVNSLSLPIYELSFYFSPLLKKTCYFYNNSTSNALRVFLKHDCWNLEEDSKALEFLQVLLLFPLSNFVHVDQKNFFLLHIYINAARFGAVYRQVFLFQLINNLKHCDEFPKCILVPLFKRLRPRKAQAARIRLYT
ncbi:hypothetical protein Ahy_B01g055221 isoform C [Arachis hypogaea]|uniref:Uncharacterized protein n=1 Tax=Arachis hypogaea TaxID=3818 RepID=A0A445AVJ7_ARAHY|nr:hypothetical protein Ahy_B01g055221 isoform C [Arachis hypogaea]